MKFNTILALVYVFLIINSSILAIQDKASMSRKRHHKSRVSLHKKSYSHSHTHKKYHTKACELEENTGRNVQVVPFLLALVTQSLMSFSSDVVGQIKSAVKLDKITKDCSDLLTARFHALIDDVKARDSLNVSVRKSFANLSTAVQGFGENKAEKEELAKRANNPRALCKYT